LAGLLAVSTASSGCLWAPELSSVCRDIAGQVPGTHFDKQFAISLGPLSIGFARFVTAFIPDARDARDYLHDVSRIQVAVYETGRPAAAEEVRMPEQLQKLQQEGWETAVKVREEDSVVWVMYHIDEDSIDQMYVVVLDDEELVLVKARGHLERLAARALCEARGTRGTRGIPTASRDDGDGRREWNGQ
jgi:hypothetical protein